MARSPLLSNLIPVVLVWLMVLPYASQSAVLDDLNLPELGAGGGAPTSLNQEHALGQRFLRAVRAQTPNFDDPLLNDYLEHQIYRLASYSDLEDFRLYIVMINNPTINAFAAPGGILGIHHGLFLTATSVHEFSAILAHELAHLSQRHFARGLEDSRKAGVISIAGLLAGAIIAAYGGGEAGIAAMTTSQGLMQAQRLSYSRTRESEADRVGINTLTRAGLDPRAMAYMFEHLDRATRTDGDQIPEFLRTHPVTRNRITDAYNQTESITKRQWPLDLEFQMMRARAIALSTSNPRESTPLLTSRQGTDDVLNIATDYLSVLLMTAAGDLDKARALLSRLRADMPLNIPLHLAEVDLYLRAKQLDSANALIDEALLINPGNYPLMIKKADIMIAMDRPEIASQLLTEVTEAKPLNDAAWYQLAEARGLSGDIIGVHQARAEYFLLNGDLERAEKQLSYAQPLARQNFQLSERIRNRLDEIRDLIDQLSR